MVKGRAGGAGASKSGNKLGSKGGGETGAGGWLAGTGSSNDIGMSPDPGTDCDRARVKGEEFGPSERKGPLFTRIRHCWEEQNRSGD